MPSWPSNEQEVPQHAANHQAEAADEVATQTPAPEAIPRTGASGVLDAWLTAALKAIAALIPGANKLAYFTSSTEATLATVGSTGLEVLAAGSQAAARTALGAEGAGSAAEAIADHVAAANPHDQYLLAAGDTLSGTLDADGESRAEARRRLARHASKRRQRTPAWADQLLRVFQVDPLACRRCGQPMQLRCVVTDSRATRRILRTLVAARGPPPAAS